MVGINVPWYLSDAISYVNFHPIVSYFLCVAYNQQLQ